jgi:hypothetical protein
MRRDIEVENGTNFGGETWESGLSGRLVRNCVMILGWK